MSVSLDIDVLMGEIGSYIEEQVKQNISLFIEAFRRIGEECINVARVKVKALPRDYQDQTGNLRSSIGYAILDDGELVDAPKIVPVTKEGREGEGEALKYIDTLRKTYPEGLVLLVVAGMDYAAYVQAKGYDVLTSAELRMEELKERMVARFQEAGIL